MNYARIETKKLKHYFRLNTDREFINVPLDYDEALEIVLSVGSYHRNVKSSTSEKNLKRILRVEKREIESLFN